MKWPEQPAPLPFCAADLSVSIAGTNRLSHVSLEIAAGGTLAVMGPARSGKSELLWAANRLLHEVPGARISGTVRVGGVDVNSIPIGELRQRVGLLIPAPLARTPFNEVAAALRTAARDEQTGERVEKALRRVGVWREVRHRLHQPYDPDDPVLLRLLCLARTLALEPGLLLLDDPTRGLDSLGRTRFEDAVGQATAAGATTLIWTTREPDQAGRVARQAAFLYAGRVVESGSTSSLFKQPGDPLTESFLTGNYQLLQRLTQPAPASPGGEHA